MADLIKVPQVGMLPAEVIIAEWNVQEGDEVKTGDTLCSVESSKAASEVISETEGAVLRILIREGESSMPGKPLAVIGAAGEEFDLQNLLPEEEPDSKAENGTEELSGRKKTSVIVVGGGPGGYVAAIRAAQLGADVTLIEERRIGGTCLNEGCIPTKCMLHSAELFHTVETEADRLGVETDGVRANYGRILENRDGIVSRLRKGIEQLFAARKITLVQGRASFADQKTLNVSLPDGTEKKLTADKIILAVGARSAVPPIPGLKDNGNCIDSTGVLQLKERPESLAIIGGGVIGMEFASVFSMLGTKVTVIEMMPSVLPLIDGEIARAAAKSLQEHGVDLLVSTAVKKVERAPEDQRLCHVTCETSDGKTITVTAEKVLVAVGRRPNTEALDPGRAGIDTFKGGILVNKRMETSADGIYAVGDCVYGEAQLAHAASAMGETAAENAMGLQTLYDGSGCPSCVYTITECAGAGLTEEQARAQGTDFRVGRFPMAANGKALILNGGEGLVKILSEKETDRILGIHMIGPHATDLISEGALAVRTRATLQSVIETIHPHPTVSEAIREAALAAEGRAVHI